MEKSIAKKDTTLPKKKPGRPKKNQNIEPIEVLGIVDNPELDGNIIELTYCNVIGFKKIVALYNNFDCDKVFVAFNKQTIDWYSVDHSNKVKIYNTIDAQYTNRYFCGDPIILNITRADLDLVFNVVNKTSTSLSLIIERARTSKLLFLIHNSEYSFVDKFEVNVTECNKLLIPNKLNYDTYPLTFKISAKHLKDELSNVSKFDGQMLRLEKLKLAPLQFGCNNTTVNWARVYSKTELIEFKSTLGPNDIFTVCINPHHISPLNSLGTDFIIHAARETDLVFISVLDKQEIVTDVVNNKRESAPLITMSVFVNISRMG